MDVEHHHHRQTIDQPHRKKSHPSPNLHNLIIARSASDAAIQSEPLPPQASPATLHTHLGTSPMSLRATKWRGNPAEPCVTPDYRHSPWIAASGHRETLLAMTSELSVSKNPPDPTCKLQEAPREAFLIPACELLQLPRDARVRPRWHRPPLRVQQGNRSCWRACRVPSAR